MQVRAAASLSRVMVPTSALDRIALTCGGTSRGVIDREGGQAKPTPFEAMAVAHRVRAMGLAVIERIARTDVGPVHPPDGHGRGHKVPTAVVRTPAARNAGSVHLGQAKGCDLIRDGHRRSGRAMAVPPARDSVKGPGGQLSLVAMAGSAEAPSAGRLADSSVPHEAAAVGMSGTLVTVAVRADRRRNAERRSPTRNGEALLDGGFTA